MVVGLDLDQDIDRFVVIAVFAGLRVGEPATTDGALDHCGVVAIGGEHPAAVLFVCVADHREQRLGLRLAVDHPVCVEDLVAAVLGVRLCKHHQLDVRRVTPEAAEAFAKVFDFIR